MLISSITGANGALRVGAWRNLKSLGAASLRDGVSLLPDRPPQAEALGGIARSITEAGGSAYLLRAGGREFEEPAIRALFDRAAEYAALTEAMRAATANVAAQTEPEARRGARQFARELARIESIDFFESGGRNDARAALAALQEALVTTFSPGEPHSVGEAIPRRDRADYQGRLWVTRRRMWVDRVASAWLIVRHIDPKARFDWVDDVARVAPPALGFDFDGAAFSHANGLCTFEVLLESFDLRGDGALARIGAIVHSLDIGGPRAPEAPGFEAVLGGMRESAAGDAELLAGASAVLDALYRAFVPAEGT